MCLCEVVNCSLGLTRVSVSRSVHCEMVLQDSELLASELHLSALFSASL